ncbi:hypothetical protein R3W88_019254 [Solanum pinnatisectum]|uniref:Uncharacterized protein n=1 Tax=Solanum pinnatisectum TaxID=50273 RepID=A0AAV9KJ05_9SOLN|nr:hypothetical protein R3W88_019254 [Solanum pinnatisectum]
MKEDVANVVSDTQKSPRDPLYQYAPPQFHHYILIQDTQYSIVPPQYAVYSAQPYAHQPNYPQWRAPTNQNVHPSSQNFRAPYNPRPRQGFEGGQRPITTTNMIYSYDIKFVTLFTFSDKIYFSCLNI